MKTLSGSFIYKGLYKDIKAEFGAEEAKKIWALSERVLKALCDKYSSEDRYNAGEFVFPAAAVFIALRRRRPGFPAMDLLRAYGTKTGGRIRKMIHAVTSLPCAAELIHKNLRKIMDHASSAALGYTRHIVSDDNDFCAVDILSCPLYDLAVRIGVPEVCQTVCAMDKVYMTGFRYIRYERTKSVAEGGDCCDYRLRWDKSKV